MSSSLFVKYGVKAGAGPAFLKRQRSAVEQPQTRTRTGSTSNQLQTRTRTCSCSTTCYYWYDIGSYAGSSQGAYCSNFGSNNYVCGDSRIVSCSWNGCTTVSSCITSSSHPGTCLLEPNYNFGAYDTCYIMYAYGPSSYSSGCNWGGWSGWSNTSSCSNSYPGCSPGAVQRECQTATVCNWSAYTAWSNVASCSPTTPACTNGALERQCQTIYSWGNWSAYEEVDICVPQTPALGAGAVEIECVPQ